MYPFKPLPSLTALRSFEAVARLGSAKAAAAELFVTPTAISHQLKQLEEELGVQLFVRQTRKLVLTHDGQRLFDAVHSGMQSMLSGVEKLKQTQTRPWLTLTTIPIIAAKLILPNMSSLKAFAPDLDLRLSMAHASLPLDGVAADVAIRYGSGQWPDVHAEPLFMNRFVPTCSPALNITKPSDLARHTLLHFDWRPQAKPIIHWQAWKTEALKHFTGAEHAALEALDTSQGLHFSDESHAYSAALAGQGIALASERLIQAELDAGLLVTPLKTTLQGQSSYWVVPTSRINEPAINAVREWLFSLPLIADNHGEHY